ncbi:Transcriptional regulator, TetR family, partial [Arthrobacter sp. DR-2P]
AEHAPEAEPHGQELPTVPHEGRPCHGLRARARGRLVRPHAAGSGGARHCGRKL